MVPDLRGKVQAREEDLDVVPVVGWAGWGEHELELAPVDTVFAPIAEREFRIRLGYPVMTWIALSAAQR